MDEALADFDVRRAALEVWRIAEEANRYVASARPWAQPRAQQEVSLGRLVGACREPAAQLEPFLPTAARRVAAAGGDRLARPRPLFPRRDH